MGSIGHQLLASLRRLAPRVQANVSRRDALMMSVGSVVPLAPLAATGQLVAGPSSDIATDALVGRPGARARTLQAKVLDIYSVNDKGARGDGKTDDTIAINAAILAVHLNGGGEIIFGASETPYYVSGPILVPSNIVIDLNGQTLVGSGSGQGTMFATAMLSDGTLKPNKGFTHEDSFVSYSSVRNGTIRRCNIAFDFKNFNISCII